MLVLVEGINPSAPESFICPQNRYIRARTPANVAHKPFAASSPQPSFGRTSPHRERESLASAQPLGSGPMLHRGRDVLTALSGPHLRAPVGISFHGIRIFPGVSLAIARAWLSSKVGRGSMAGVPHCSQCQLQTVCSKAVCSYFHASPKPKPAKANGKHPDNFNGWQGLCVNSHLGTWSFSDPILSNELLTLIGVLSSKSNAAASKFWHFSLLDPD